LVKNCCPFIAGDLKAFFLFFCFDFLHIDPSKDFCFCKFFAKGLKSEGERLKVKFWSSEIVKIGRGQHNYRRCRSRHHLQSYVMMKTTVYQISNGCLEKFQNIALLAVAILFLSTFLNLILDAPRSTDLHKVHCSQVGFGFEHCHGRLSKTGRAA
jgi:hypothetical protein